jgi:hypothetical protein
MVELAILEDTEAVAKDTVAVCQPEVCPDPEKNRGKVGADRGKISAPTQYFPYRKKSGQMGAQTFFRVGAKLGNRCRTKVSLIRSREYKHLSNRIETKKIGANRGKNPIKMSVSRWLGRSRFIRSVLALWGVFARAFGPSSAPSRP